MASPAGSPPSALRAGARCLVEVPGSSANLGPGFDSLGLAVNIVDTVEVELREPGVLEIEVTGEAADEVPRDERHLVVKLLRHTLERVGVREQPGLWVRCHNTIPHGRGVGSSAAAIVSGVLAARGLLADPSLLDDQLALQIATDAEGHPDNAAASLFGSAVLGWMAGTTAQALRLPLHPEIVAVLAIPDVELATAKARAMLPATVPHADAAFVAGRAALLVRALTDHPELLLDATEDRLHQGYRAPAMPATAALVQACRAEGLAATVSGAGPTVLVLAGSGEGSADGVCARVASLAEQISGAGWTVLQPGISLTGGIVTRRER